MHEGKRDKPGLGRAPATRRRSPEVQLALTLLVRKVAATVDGEEGEL